MCGLAGVLFKDASYEPSLGKLMLDMLGVLGSRGMDGTGVALYGPESPGQLVVRARFENVADNQFLADQVADAVNGIADVLAIQAQNGYLRLEVNYQQAPKRLVQVIESVDPGIAVFSVGNSLEIVKELGPASRLEDLHGLGSFAGTHGIGHTRLATESRVDIAHCHPFWARPYSDIAVVHNGQITNYHKMRRLFEMRGHKFTTENDSEIIALFLGEKISKGSRLEDAMRDSLEVLDGTFTYLVSVPEGLGLVRDAYASKPMVIAETDRWIALASEEIALRRAIIERFDTWEPPARTVQVWRRSPQPGKRPAVAAARS